MDQSRPLHRGSGCHECRRRKLKCSGTKPSCDRCARSNTACVYDPVEKSKVALLRDELLMLREKVRALEKTHGLGPGGLDADKGLKRRSPDDGLPVVPRPAPSPPGQWRVSLTTEDQTKLLNQFTAIQHVANEYAGVAPNPHPAAEPYAAKTAAFLLASFFSPTHRHLQADLLECTRHCIEDAIRGADQPTSPHSGSSPTRPSAASPKRSGTSPRLGSPRSPRIVHPLALRPNAAIGSGLVLDAIHASSLLAVWMLIQGRLVECQQALFGAAKLAIMSGMHTIRSLDERPSGEPSPAQLSMDKPSHSNIGDERASNPGDERALNHDSRPSSSGGRLPDSRERPVRHRVGVFWQLVCLDYTAAILMGSPTSLPWEDCPTEVRVETVWPDCEATCASISSLFRGSKSSLSLHAKSIVLLERAVRLSAQREPGQTLIKETDTAISNVLEQLPASRSASLHPHTLMLCARVRLHEASAARDHVSQVVWVQSAVAIVRLLDSIDEAEVVARADLLMAYSWIASYMVLLHEQYYVPYLPESDHAVRIGLDLGKLKGLLDTVGARMPVVDTMFKSAINQFHTSRTPTSPYASPPSDTPSTPEKISLPKASTPSKSCASDDIKTEHDELADEN